MWNDSVPLGWILMVFDIGDFLRISVEKSKVLLKSEKNNGYFYLEDIFTFMTISCSILFRMRNVSDKVVEKIRTHI